MKKSMLLSFSQNPAGLKFSIVFVFLPVLLVLFPGGFLHGQTAANMDELLDSREITWAQACRFVLPASGVLGEHAAAPAAFDAARERGWLPKGAAADGSVNLGGLSFLIMKSFSIKGSLLYALFPGSRYAYRQMDYLGLIPGLRDPALNVSGERLLQILGRVLNYRGDEEPEAAAERGPDIPAGNRIREETARNIREEMSVRGVEDATVRVVDEGVTISLNNIHFLPDDTVLTEGERMNLMRLAVILNRYSGRKILVGGHTALAGTEEGRLLVSTRRARAVADFLVFLDGLKPEDITVRGYGAERPLGDNSTAEGQAINRRVEITILDKEGHE
jgi:outer membrane protein OmpA-like peptidoglycan-associated protein